MPHTSASVGLSWLMHVLGCRVVPSDSSLVAAKVDATPTGTTPTEGQTLPGSVKSSSGSACLLLLDTTPRCKNSKGTNTLLTMANKCLARFSPLPRVPDRGRGLLLQYLIQWLRLRTHLSPPEFLTSGALFCGWPFVLPHCLSLRDHQAKG